MSPIEPPNETVTDVNALTEYASSRLRSSDWDVVDTVTTSLLREQYPGLSHPPNVPLRLVVASVYLSTRLLHSAPPKNPRDQGVNYQNLLVHNPVRSIDHPLWLIESATTPERLFVMVHGWGSGRASLSGHSMVDFLPALSELGDVAIFDQAGHGAASGLYTFGLLESADVIAVTTYLRARKKYKHIVGLAFCFGCYPTLIAHSTTGLFDRCILEGFLPVPALFTVATLHQRIFRLPLRFARATEAAARILVPALASGQTWPKPDNRLRSSTALVFGDADTYIRPDTASCIRDLLPGLRVHTVQGVGHVRTFFQARFAWKRIFSQTLEERICE